MLALPLINSSIASGGEVTGGPIDLSKCNPGNYDTVHIITSRYTEFSEILSSQTHPVLVTLPQR